MDVIVEPLVKRGYRWASTYGNHDSKYNLTREGILREEQKYPNAYTRHGPPGTDGVSNYVIPLFASAGRGSSSAASSPCNDALCEYVSTSEKPVALLYFLDSRGGSENSPENDDNIQAYVSAPTAAWFRGVAVAAKRRWGVLPSLVFNHIPINAFLDLQNTPSADVGGSHFPGLDADVPLDQQGNNAASNGDYTGQDVPFMQAMLDTEGVHSVYSGHDHGDSWCGLWQNRSTPSTPSLNKGVTFAGNHRPFLCFTKHGGFGG